MDPKPAALAQLLLFPPQHCWPWPQLLYCPYLHVCVCACVSSCTHTQLMKSKCPAAVVAVVRLSRCRHSEATTRPDWSWSKHVWEQQINWSPREFFFFLNSLWHRLQFIKHYHGHLFIFTTDVRLRLRSNAPHSSISSFTIHPPALQFHHLYSNYSIVDTDLFFPLCPPTCSSTPFFPSQVNSAARRSQIRTPALPCDAWSSKQTFVLYFFFSTKVTQGNNKAFSMLGCIPTLKGKQTCSSLSHHNPNPPTPATTLLNPLLPGCPVLLIKQIYFSCI